MPARDDMDESNSWSVYRREVMKALTDLDGDIRTLESKAEGNFSSLSRQMQEHRDRLQARINELEVQVTRDITALKTKASSWGATFGAIGGAVLSAIVSLIFQALRR